MIESVEVRKYLFIIILILYYREHLLEHPATHDPKT